MFDTPLVLALRAGDAELIRFFKAWTDAERVIAIGTATALEVLAQSTDDDDRNRRFRFLENSAVLPLNADVGKRAEQFALHLPVPTRLTADDLLVAATALLRKLPVYSLDPGRYAAVPGLTALSAH